MFIDQLKNINMGAFNQCTNKKGNTPASCGLEPNQYAGYYSPRKVGNDPKFWPEQIKDGSASDNKLYPNKKFPTGKNKDGIPNRVDTYRQNIKRHITNNGLLCSATNMDDTKCFPSMGTFQPNMKPAGLTSDADNQNPEKTNAEFADKTFAIKAHIEIPKPQTQ